MDRINNLFIVETEFEFFNAVEILHQYKLGSSRLIFVNYTKKSNSEIKKYFLEYNEFTDIEVVQIYSIKREFILLKKILKYRKIKLDNIFVGQVRRFEILLLSNVNANNSFYFDDGLGTVLLYNNDYFNNLHIKKNKFLKILYKLFSLKMKVNCPLSIFTIFDLKNKRDIRIVKNSYNYWKNKKKNNQKIDNNLVYIIGQPLIESKYLTKNQYIKYLKKIRTISKNKQIVYIKHKGESDISFIKECFDDFLCIDSDNIFEKNMLNSYILPYKVYGFFSTLLFTLNIIFDNINIISIKIDTDYKRRQQHLQKIYQYITGKFQVMET